MAMMSKTRDLIEGLVREKSFKWALSRRASFEDEYEEMGRSPSGRRKCIPDLSSVANVIVGRCSQILDVPMDELQRNFDSEASDAIKHPSSYARNFLEYCCFRTLALSTQVAGHLSDKAFRRLTFDMMFAWEAPAAADQPIHKMVDKERTAGAEAFSRIAPAIPTIADVITCFNLFDKLTNSTGGRLTLLSTKYLAALDRYGQREPGRLILTDHALYFEALRLVTFDKPKVYELADDLNQIIKPELTGPWGSRLFDKAVMYKSISLTSNHGVSSLQVILVDYWLAIMREILYAHRFIRKFEIEGVEKEETLSKAVLGILRLQAIQELVSSVPVKYETLLMFNLCDQLPGGDVILETLANMIASRKLDRTNQFSSEGGMYSISALGILSNLGLVSQVSADDKLLVGEIVVGEMTSLERAVDESRNSYKQVEQAQATVDGVKVDGLDTNLVVMKELLQPMIQLGNFFVAMASWNEPIKSLVFSSLSCFIIFRGWLGYVLVLVFLFVAIFMLLTRFTNQGRPINQIKVKVPPVMNTMEQILAVQNAISKVEELVQDGNIVLLKIRALLLAVSSQATDRIILVLVLMALAIAFLPSKLLLLMLFLEIFTRNSPPRRVNTEKCTRRLREWWFSIPAAPVVLERDKEDKKKR
ncbi:hypothetical protein MUK42_15977 [Musa troglodytarum]|uniref:Uncharacterized protein n=1 Tax=Musa troglodytarum TaxID=320322 RepID=A0A9E7HTP4_9LILI|nr:hypothetical protein MUK42_15977 [Musa troglodytarum]